MRRAIKATIGAAAGAVTGAAVGTGIGAIALLGNLAAPVTYPMLGTIAAVAPAMDFKDFDTAVKLAPLGAVAGLAVSPLAYVCMPFTVLQVATLPITCAAGGAITGGLIAAK